MAYDYNALSFFLYAVSSLFVIINPFSTASLFLSLAEDASKKEKKEIIRDATLLGTIILFVFGVTGLYIFKFFGITIPAFKIAGGIILAKIAFNMLRGNNKKLHKSHFQYDTITIVPLAIPLLSGPGAITTVVVLISENPGLQFHFLTFLAILVNMIIVYIVLVKSDTIKKVLKEKGFRAVNKVMGIILMSISVQFIINGLTGAFPMLLG